MQAPKAALWAAAATGLALLGAAAWFARAQTRDIRREVEANLRSIADLKVCWMEDWWAERYRDAAVLAEDEQFAALAAGAEEPRQSSRLERRLESIRRNYDYSQIIVFNA